MFPNSCSIRVGVEVGGFGEVNNSQNNNYWSWNLVEGGGKG
jgi:hypothetical protein